MRNYATCLQQKEKLTLVRFKPNNSARRGLEDGWWDGPSPSLPTTTLALLLAWATTGKGNQRQGILVFKIDLLPPTEFTEIKHKASYYFQYL